jgi:hypothetical protein
VTLRWPCQRSRNERSFPLPETGCRYESWCCMIDGYPTSWRIAARSGFIEVIELLGCESMPVHSIEIMGGRA